MKASDLNLTGRKPVLILGIGNVLMGDEGAGVHLAQALEQEVWPEGIEVLDGGTGGFHLMSYFEGYETVILIDATLDDREPGTIRQIRPRFAADFPATMSTHEIGLKDLMGGLTLLDRLPDLHLFVVSIATVQPMDMNLSSPVAAVMPELKAKVTALAHDCLSETSTI